MALWGRSERGIGRGEVAESHLEAPFFAVFLLFCSVLILVLQLYVGNQSITLAAAISMLVFGTTVARVEFGVSILVISMLLSPEIEAGNEFSGEYTLNLRYDDILIAIIFMGVMVRLSFEGRLKLWRPSPINAGIVLYYSVCMFSNLLALKHGIQAWDRESAFFVSLKMVEFYMVYFLTVQALRSMKDIRNQLVLFFIVGVIVSGYGIYSIGTTPRVGAPFDAGGTEPNTLGGYLVIVICAAMGLYTQAPRRSLRFVFLGLSLMAFVPLLYTLSRASYIALIGGMAVLGVISRRYIILAALGLGLLASPFVVPKEVKERVMLTVQTEGAQPTPKWGPHPPPGRELRLTVDKSTEERFLVWRKVRYLMGVGWVYALFGGGVSWESVMDSQYARVFLETGIVGFIAFAYLQYCLLRSSRQSYRWATDWVGRGLCMGVFACITALILHGMGTISFLIVRVMEPFWFLVAITVIIRNLSIAERWERYHVRQRAERQRQEQAQVSAPATAAIPHGV